MRGRRCFKERNLCSLSRIALLLRAETKATAGSLNMDLHLDSVLIQTLRGILNIYSSNPNGLLTQRP